MSFFTVQRVSEPDPVQHNKQAKKILKGDLFHPWQTFKKQLPCKTDSKIFHLLIYGGLLTAAGMYLLFGFWPISNLIFGSKHVISQIIFHISYFIINVGCISILASTIFRMMQWIRANIEENVLS